MGKAVLDDFGLKRVVYPYLVKEGWVDLLERSQHVRIVMRISDVLKKCSDIFLDFEDCLATANICFSIILEAFGFVEEFCCFVCLKGLESIHLQ